MTTPTTRPGRLPRLIAAVAVASTTTVVFAALGGVGFAKTAISAAQYQYGPGQKVTLCHKPGTPAEHTISVSHNAVPAHMAHGDKPGTCAQVAAKEQAKAEKAKAKAEAKAAKAKAKAEAKAAKAKAKAAKAKAAKLKAAEAKAAKLKAAKAKAAKAKAAKLEAEKAQQAAKAKADKAKGAAGKAKGKTKETGRPADPGSSGNGKGNGNGKGRGK